MKEVFLLSGLGADKRVFKFLDLSGYRANYIEWIEPRRNEHIEEYAKRLLPQIHKTNPILIGVSFGGIMAIEIGKIIPVEKIILISSAQTRSDIPGIYRVIGRSGVHQILPSVVLKRLPFKSWFFGIENERDKKLLKAIMHDTNNQFLRWAINELICWKNLTVPSNTVHIHGTNDRLLPNNKANFKIHNGGHFMIVNKATEISQIVQHTLKEF